jgi:hypothetical protein
MAKKTQLSPMATPGRRYSFSAKTEAEILAVMKRYFWRIAYGAIDLGEI